MPNAAAWRDFAATCLKPGSNRLGTWTARRWARPVALRITYVVAPWGVSAHQATSAALAIACAACAALAVGSPAAWLAAGLLLEVWYVLDHVDGQLARRRGAATLDGTMFDYLMHHSVQLLVPLCAAYGMARQSCELDWIWAGVLWCWGSILIGLRHDARYKAFIQRLKVLDGTLDVVGGGGGRPVADFGPKRTLAGVAKWCLLKCLETHILAHALCGVGLLRCLLPDAEFYLAAATVLLPATTALPAAVFLAGRDIHRGAAEREFAAWFRIPQGATLELREGRWVVESAADSELTAS